MPLGRARAVPRIVRVVLAAALAPIFAERIAYADAGAIRFDTFASSALLNALEGAACGICATVVAGAAAAAGQLFDAALASQSIPARDVFENAGPISALAAALFGWLFMGTGAFDNLVTICSAMPLGIPDVHTAAALGEAFFRIALAAGAPALAAQSFATVVAALIARMAPRINGLFLGAPIGATLTIGALVIGCGGFVAAMVSVALHSAAAPHALRS